MDWHAIKIDQSYTVIWAEFTDEQIKKIFIPFIKETNICWTWSDSIVLWKLKKWPTLKIDLELVKKTKV